MHPAGCWTGHSSPADVLVRCDYDKNMINTPFRLGSIVPCTLPDAGQTHGMHTPAVSKHSSKLWLLLLYLNSV